MRRCSGKAWQLIQLLNQYWRETFEQR